MISPPRRIRVFIVEDHAVVRQGLVMLLSAHPEIDVVGSAKDGQDAVAQFPQLLPDITLMDLQMPVKRGVEAIQEIIKRYVRARFIVLTTFDGDEDIFRALQAGASTYLLKGMDIEELVETIRAVHAGKARLPAAIQKKLAARGGAEELTARELDVLRRIVAGRANKEIASDLCISEPTVKSHVNNLLAKLRASDRTHATVLALQRGIVHLP